MFLMPRATVLLAAFSAERWDGIKARTRRQQWSKIPSSIEV
jgi:hypothetical protein